MQLLEIFKGAMKMNKKRVLGIAIVLVILVGVICGGFAAYKIYKHEKKQNQQIMDIQGTVSLLNTKINSKSENVEWNAEDYNYLAIGNSLTKHGASSYWWHGNNGMAASDSEHDYFHIVLGHLNEFHNNVHGEALGTATWEVQGHDRDETFFLFDPYLDQEIDLVTIQLGENASNLETFERDYESLINYIKSECPKARIMVIGDFWTYANRDELKKEASKNTGVEYVSLDGIKDKKEYQAGMGTTVYDEEGNAHQIDHEGVAGHPGDKGMQAIAERVIEAIDK